MSYKACIVALGEIEDGNTFVHFEDKRSRRATLAPVMSTEYAQHLTASNDRLPQMILQAVRFVLEQKNILTRLWSETDELHVLVDSHGGTLSTTNQVIKKMIHVGKQAGDVHVYAGNIAQSGGGNIAIGACKNAIHCLTNTDFMWHLPRIEEEVSLDEAARIEGHNSINEFLMDHAGKQRKQIEQLLIFYSLRAPQSSLEMKQKIAKTFYTDADQAALDYQSLANLWRRLVHGGSATTWDEYMHEARQFQAFYRKEGELRISGSEMQNMGIAKCHDAVSLLAKKFSDLSKWNTSLGKMRNIWETFFTASRIMEIARKEGLHPTVHESTPTDFSFFLPSEEMTEPNLLKLRTITEKVRR